MSILGKLQRSMTSRLYIEVVGNFLDNDFTPKFRRLYNAKIGPTIYPIFLTSSLAMTCINWYVLSQWIQTNIISLIDVGILTIYKGLDNKSTWIVDMLNL